MTSPIERYDALRNNNNFIFVVCKSSHIVFALISATNPSRTVYRGAWCPFCQAYLRQLQALSSDIAAEGGKVFTVTAEAESELPKMRAASGYTGETIVDPENQLTKELKRRGIIDIAISNHKGYPHGMAQPGVLAGGNKGILYRWNIVPATVSPTCQPVSQSDHEADCSY